jgi:hypothetical protein
MGVAVTCQKCGEKRYQVAGPIAAAIREGSFRGKCSTCAPSARKNVWTVLSPGRKVNPVTGYVLLSKSAIAPEDVWLWHAMKKSGNYVTEHRMAMARKLGRPLASHELVDHMDGNKLNNDPSNLRLYKRGRNMPGDNIGYGTFYDEWQRAEARVRELEARLAG